MPTNLEFLTALFGEDAQWAHVTDFMYDPVAIPAESRFRAWGGNYFSRYKFTPGSNQYFTISTFYADEKGKARRRISLYRCTHVIVLDDVKEKLNIDQVAKLPPPTWILETSPGSEQWGYKLNHVEVDRERVENLLDGLVANGLAPDGKDPGMKGVTRYVRLPEGCNLKASKMIDGKPFKCRTVLWEPGRTVSLEQLAEPFGVNLSAPRRQTRLDGASKVDGHPLLQLTDIVVVKDELSDGRFDITCPWVDEHTHADDSGTAVFTNRDGSIGFKCHHGACQHRTGSDLLTFIEEAAPGFKEKLKTWQIMKSFEDVPLTKTMVKRFSFLEGAAEPARPAPDVPVPAADPDAMVKGFIDQLRTLNPRSPDAREVSSKLLKAVDGLSPMERLGWHEQIRDVMNWSKPDFKVILSALREEWYKKENAVSVDCFKDVVFVKELNQFYDRDRRIFYTPEAYQNAHSHLDEEVRQKALQGNLVVKVDKLDYCPGKPPLFRERGVNYGNTWSDATESPGRPGDVSVWWNHFDVLGWGEYRDHIIQWMAFTIQHPDVKINHMLLLGSDEGTGKDWLLYPLRVALGENHTTIDGEELLSGYHDWALATKHLHINEAELGDRKEALAVSAKIKPLAAAPPDTLRVNQKHVKALKIRNLLSVSMTTNSQVPLRLNGESRRILALWSYLQVRDEDGNMLPQWREFWQKAWEWMKGGGAEFIVHYLRHVVDVSNFKPGTAPPVTEFLRDIRDASKSPAQQTIEAFIRHRVGCFVSDLVTTTEVCETLKAGPIIAEHLMYADPDLFTPTRVGLMLKETKGVVQLRGRSKPVEVRVWAVRDATTYQGLSPADVLQEYDRQIKAAKEQTRAKLRVVQ